jgi:phosphoesterase RecJ-like protein
MEPLAAYLRDQPRFVLVSHVRPDGDAVGSLLGLSYGLAQLGKEVTTVLLDGVPSTFDYLVDRLRPVHSTLPQPDTESFCIVLDAADAARTGDRDTVKLYASRQRLLVIDHHPLGDLEPRAVAYYHDMQASSASEMVYDVLVSLGCRITPQIATCLYTGMYTDTSGFKHSNTTTHTLGVASELLKRGANLRKIVAEIGQQKSIPRLKLIGTAMQRLALGRKSQVAYSVIQNEDIALCNAAPEEVRGIINQVNALPEVSFFMMLTEEAPGLIRGSLRVPDGKTRFSVRPLAKLLGGGGHASAAGFELSGSIANTKSEDSPHWQIT